MEKGTGPLVVSARVWYTHIMGMMQNGFAAKKMTEAEKIAWDRKQAKIRREMKKKGVPHGFDRRRTPEGTSNGYGNYGCRCQKCRDAWAVYYSQQVRATLRKKPIPGHVHGTPNGYSNYSCRCADCTRAHTEQMVRRRKERLAEGMEGVVHGRASTYANYRCRCDACRRAATEDQRRRRKEKHRRKEKPDYIHGSELGYSEWGCRCEDCKQAHRLRLDEINARRRANTAEKKRFDTAEILC